MIDREHPTWRLADRFVVETRLGQGAMGEVFRAYDEHQQRTVALKVLKPERSQSGRLQRFKREFRAAARLEHPYCVRSHELVEREGLAMLVMDYVPGGALVLRRFEHVADVVRLALQLLAGLDHIHGKRLVHRDLKPSNILVERPLAGPLHPRLCDFGITDVHRLELPGLEPRGALLAELTSDDGPFRILAAHLGLLARSRKMQFAAIRAALSRRTQMPTILIGDYNEWSSRGGSAALGPEFHTHTPGPSFPAARPVARLDRI